MPATAVIRRHQAALNDLEQRLDAARRKCTTGYGCGSTCISVQKECRSQGGAATSKERIARLEQLARGEIKPRGIGALKPEQAQAKAEALRGQRSSRATALVEERAAKRAAAAAATAKPKAGNPRTNATSIQEDDDYAFARKSAVQNAGEDLANSARHKRNAFRTIEEAEASGQAQKLITRDNLLKNFPVDLITGIEPTNCLSRLESHYCLKAFPGLSAKAVTGYVQDEQLRQLRGGGRRAGREIEAVDEKTLRKQYFDAFQSVRDFVEANKDMPAGEMRSALAKRLSDLIGRYRKTEGQGYQRTYGDPFNPVANALVDMHKRLTKRGSTSVYGQMDKFAKALAADVGADWRQNPAKSMGRAAEAATKIMEGESLAKAFGQQGSSGKWRFNPADHYVGHARREGGRQVGGTPGAATDEIIKGLGFRGLQYGNSVTDDERAHHVQKAAEALVDLADAIGLPDRAIGLNGTLGLAIGARGRGGAVAHYEPDLKVINLTRKNGVGSLSHEWGHALDNYVSGGAGFLSQFRSRSGSREAVNAMSALQSAWSNSGYTKQVYDTLRAIKKAGGMLSESYWLSSEEMFARSFEAYVSLKLAKAGRANTYLTREFDEAGMRKGNDSERAGDGLWPTRQQAEAMEPMFDALMARIRQDDFPGGVRRDSRQVRIGRFRRLITSTSVESQDQRKAAA